MLDYGALSSVVDDEIEAADFAEELAFSDSLPRVDNPNGLSWTQAAEIIEESEFSPDEVVVNGFSKPKNMIRAAAATVISEELKRRL